MARYKHYDDRQSKMLPISFDRQVLPGTFEHTLSYLIDERIDLSMFDERYQNDEGGAPAYDPALLLKITLFAYSKGITSSRKIEQLCRENVVCMALSADSAPHWTTIASFVSSSAEEIAQVFRRVLLVCDEAGLIGREMFAIDGVKLPSNASKEWSGARLDLKKKSQKMQRAVEQLLQQHRFSDEAPESASMMQARERQVRTLNRAIEKIEGFLATHEEKIGRAGKPVQSNVTDNESAKMRTNKGVIQGYNGVAVVDAQHQVVVEAQAFGESQEHGLLVPMLERTRESFKALDLSEDILQEVKLTADAGYSSEANAQYVLTEQIEGYVADGLFRKRDARFAEAERHKPTRPDEPFAKPKRELRFQPKDFQLAADHSHAICPAGKRLYCCARPKATREYWSVRFRAPISACANCPLRVRCLRHPERTRVRQVAFFFGRTNAKPEKYLHRMQRRIDSPLGRYYYSRRLGIVEPVFGNVRHTKGLNRFTLRGRRKVNAQWQLYCLVHNIEKLQRYGNYIEHGARRKRAS
jgi:transposase